MLDGRKRHRGRRLHAGLLGRGMGLYVWFGVEKYPETFFIMVGVVSFVAAANYIRVFRKTEPRKNSRYFGKFTPAQRWTIGRYYTSA